MKTYFKKLMNSQMIFILVVFVLLGSIIGSSLLCASCETTFFNKKINQTKEGFAGMCDGTPVEYDLGGDDPNSWINTAATSSTTYKGLTGDHNTASKYSSNTNIKGPLQPGELYYFNKNEFSADCCKGNMFRSDIGCPCMSKDQIKYLNQRGGNRTCYSDV